MANIVAYLQSPRSKNCTGNLYLHSLFKLKMFLKKEMFALSFFGFDTALQSTAKDELNS